MATPLQGCFVWAGEQEEPFWEDACSCSVHIKEGLCSPAAISAAVMLHRLLQEDQRPVHESKLTTLQRWGGQQCADQDLKGRRHPAGGPKVAAVCCAAPASWHPFNYQSFRADLHELTDFRMYHTWDMPLSY